MKMNTVEDARNYLDGFASALTDKVRKPLHIQAVIGDKTYGIGCSDDWFGGIEGIWSAIRDARSTLNRMVGDGHVLESATTKTVKIPNNYNPKGYNTVTKMIFRFTK